MNWREWREVRLLDAPGTISNLGCPHSLSADGETLVTLHDSDAYLLDVQSWSSLGSFHPNGWVWDLKLTPDGKKIAVRDSSSIRLWDVRDVQNQATIYTGSAVEQIAFANSGKMFATFGEKKVSLWDTQTLKQLPGLTEPDATISVMAFSRAGRIATAAEDGTLKLWNMETREPSLVLKACSKPLSLSFATDEQTVAVGCTNGNVELWETTRGQRLKLSRETPVQCVLFCSQRQASSRRVAMTRQLDYGIRLQAGSYGLAIIRTVSWLSRFHQTASWLVQAKTKL